MKEKLKNNTFGILYTLFLIGFTIYIILDTFVIKKTYIIITENSQNTDEQSVPDTSKEFTLTDYSYNDENISIIITQYRKYNTNIYVADINLSSSKYLKTALSNNIYGKNITEKTSEIANENQAILAINGDYYGAQTKGYVLRNGTVYRETARKTQEDLVIYNNGEFEIINEEDITLQELASKNANQVLSFGPSLIQNYKITVSEDEEVGKAMASNPRTAIGIIDSLHYVFVVSDGRTTESNGLSLYQLAQFLKELNIKSAYNLDGGGSSTMYFNGKIINKPTTNGKKISERSVSDIVYIGYE